MIIANNGTLEFNEVVDERMTRIEESKNKKKWRRILDFFDRD